MLLRIKVLLFIYQNWYPDRKYVDQSKDLSFRFVGKYHDILQAFSYSHTIKKMASESNTEDGMECMHGMKAISMFLIIMGHRIMFAVSSPVENPIFVESVSIC